MGIGDSMKKLIGIEEVDPEDEITEEDVEEEKAKLEKENVRAEKPRFTEEKKRAPYTQVKPQERRFTAQTNAGTFKLLLIEPKSFEECPKLVDSLKSRRPIIINLEKIETDTARKIFDFLSGAIYALNGNVTKVANNIFVFAPENVDIAGGQQPEKSNFDFTPEQDAKKDTSNPWR
ncbi:MAG: cell division protein SepF [Eubacteriales bacterium]|nr:cell division protein SepF [Eubacteriales bacterium]